MRSDARTVLTSSCLFLAAACGGGDLTLPSDATPAALIIVAGDGQSATEGSPVADPLVVQLEDDLGRPMPGAHVEFRFVGEPPGADVDPGTAPTDERGRAEARAVLGRREGPQTIEALVAVPGEDLRVHFQLIAVSEDDDEDDGGDGDLGGAPESPVPPPPSGGDDGGGGGQGGGGDRGSGGGDEGSGGDDGRDDDREDDDGGDDDDRGGNGNGRGNGGGNGGGTGPGNRGD